jgi:hypothetical protein
MVVDLLLVQDGDRSCDGTDRDSAARSIGAVPLWRFQNMPRNARAADGGDGWDAGLIPALVNVRKCESAKVRDKEGPF